MQVNNSENLIFQLTNVGASQQVSTLENPKNNLRTRKNSATPSPSSKGKKWSEKLGKLQLNGGKGRKSSISPMSIATPSMTHPSVMTPPFASQTWNPPTPFSAPMNHAIGSRTSSLPRPSSSVFQRAGSTSSRANSSDTVKRLAPPRVIPFGYSRDRISPKKSFLKETCNICDEPITSRSNGERAIEFDCGHIFHQECLLLSIETKLDEGVEDLLNTFPPCRGCFKDTGNINRCIPKDPDLRDWLISVSLLNRSTRYAAGGAEPTKGSSLYLRRKLETPTTNRDLHTISRQILRHEFPTNGASRFEISHVPKKKANEKIKLCDSSYKIGTNSSIVRSERASIFAPESIISSVKDCESLISNEVSEYNSLGHPNSRLSYLPLLRSYFIEALIKTWQNQINDWQIDETFGLLRCVDKLAVSKNGVQFKTGFCYLFEKYLLISEISNSRSCNTGEFKFERFDIYGPISSAKVNTVDASVLKCSIIVADKNQWEDLYLKECLDGSCNKTIQKWISGLLDCELSFNESNFTSTLSSLPIIERLPKNECRSIVGLVTPSKLLEMTTLEEAGHSVIIKRGLSLLGDNQLSTKGADGISALMTSISSVLSLKREKPEDLVIILQLDLQKLEKDLELLVIENSLKALSSKFSSLKVCLVDPDGLLMDSSLSLLGSMPGLLRFDLKARETKFDPQWLKNKLYPEVLEKNVGVAIVSNSTMQNEKSCLLKDYKPFACVGKRRPNELKLKVGYLNADYSDRISELVELESWNYILEAISYSFRLYFGEDEDEDDEDEDEDEDECSDYYNEDEQKVEKLTSDGHLPGNDDADSYCGAEEVDLEVSPIEKCISRMEEFNSCDAVTSPQVRSQEIVLEPICNGSYSKQATSTPFMRSLGPTDASLSFISKKCGGNIIENPRSANEAWSPLFHDIKQVIQDIEENSSSKSSEAATYQSIINNYL